MIRREFLTLLGGAVVAWPLAARAQQATQVVGLLTAINLPDWATNAIRAGLGETGYAEGRNLTIIARSAEGHFDRLPALAADLVNRNVAVILATSSPVPARAAKAATTTIPVVFAYGGDPVADGLVDSLNRPGGNVTGVLFRAPGLAGKQVELALQLVPGLTRLGFIVNVATGVIIDRQELEETCKKLGITAVPAEVRTPDDLNGAYRAIADARVEAIVVLVDGMFFQERERMAALAAELRLPAVYGFRTHVDAGGLVSYGVSRLENYRRSAYFIRKILDGTKPADLPVEQPTRVELSINVRTAKALNLVLSPTLLAQADEVVE